MALKSILVKRKEKVLPSNRLECGICKQRFWMTCKYIDHMSTHKHFLLSCNICNKGFYNQKHLDEHYLTHKEVTNTYDCSQCPRKFLQMYQLEQHMQFHTVATSSKESTASKRKTVHFKTTLESRDVDDNFLNNDDFEDEVDEDDFDDDDFDEEEDFDNDDDDDDYDYKPSNRVTKTRSGRIVKTKKMFDNEAKVKHKKNFDEVTSAENVEQTVVINTTNAVIGKPLVMPSSPINVSVPLKKLDKELRVLTEKIPEHIYKKYMAKGNVCIRDIYKNQKSANANLSNNCQTLTLNNKLNRNESKVLKVMSKSNIATVVSANSNLSSDSKQNKPPEDNLNNKTMSSSLKLSGKSKSDETCIINFNTSLKLLKKPVQSYSSLDNKMSTVIEKPVFISSAPSQISLHPSPRVDKQFLYIGPKQDINTIKTVIEEMKAMSNSDVKNSKSKSPVKTSNLGLPENRCIKSPQNIRNLNMKNSVTNTDTSILPITSNSSDNKGNSTDDKKQGKSNESGISSFEAKDGFLERKVVKDFIVIKVTPELMQKMQRESMESRQRKFQTVVKSDPVNLKSLPVTSSLNKDLNEVLPEIQLEENKAIEKNHDTGQISSGMSSTMSNTNIIDQAANRVISVNTVNKEKMPEQNTDLNNLPKNNTQIDFCNFELSTPGLKEKLLQRYKAKIEEKERRKKEKYEFKKKMRYMEKLLSIENPNVTVSTKKKYKLPNSTVSNISIKDERSKLMKNVKNTELSDKLNKKLVATNMHELESRVNNPYTATLDTSETFAPSNSSQYVDSSHSVDSNSSRLVTKRSQHQNLKSKRCKTIEEEAIQKAYEISSKFEKTLSEKECLNLLDQLDNLVTNFNISDKCLFLHTIVRFCKLYVESYKVKERAISLYSKITKSKM